MPVMVTSVSDDGFSAWSSRFDRRLDDIFSVQDEIAGMIAQTLTHRVGGVSGPLVTSTTSSTQAYSLYLEGRYLWNKRPGDVVWQALDRFERAIAIDPNFAPAHAALAGVYGAINSAPVINVPEVAIMGVHKIVERPVIRDGQIVARPMMNAAIGFAREKSPRGVPVFVQTLKDIEEWAKSPTTGPNAAERGFEQQIMLRNTLHAVTMLGPTLGASERAEFVDLFQKLEASLQDSALRLQVKEARLELEKA